MLTLLKREKVCYIVFWFRFVDSFECVSASPSLTQSSPCQSHNYSRWSDIIHSIHCENRFTNVVLQVVRRNSHSDSITTNNSECHLTENLRNIFKRDHIRCTLCDCDVNITHYISVTNTCSLPTDFIKCKNQDVFFKPVPASHMLPPTTNSSYCSQSNQRIVVVV